MTDKLNRRAFLSLNWESTVGFLGNFIAPQLELERDFFRPPGACEELEFLTSCERCGKCQEVCPEQSIILFSISSGAKLVNTPYLDPNTAPCTFCKRCIDVCPTNALNASDFEVSPKLGYVQIQPNGCLAFQHVMCDYCVRACPVSGAIQIVDGIPVISRQSCTGCGICISRCIAEGSALKIKISSVR
ncbi:4Fe-4S dicluster domain-containing protein [Bacillus sp. MRMR6]|uniref:4Fe-4S dicluster domain-containing protein n=1 Tax=Bacillus sp. MRMR6 TaxID=1928617 RepID=UPI0009512541|nr:4Fe-4S dicluster domain-containing protein [Bacillus sp. MRMR6]OLS40349.1 quinol dehydrogenase [Bacillus sp. MRMR6]